MDVKSVGKGTGNPHNAEGATAFRLDKSQGAQALGGAGDDPAMTFGFKGDTPPVANQRGGVPVVQAGDSGEQVAFDSVAPVKVPLLGKDSITVGGGRALVQG